MQIDDIVEHKDHPHAHLIVKKIDERKAYCICMLHQHPHCSSKPFPHVHDELLGPYPLEDLIVIAPVR